MRLKLRQLMQHRVVQNALALYSVYIAGAVLALVTVPFLARVLGPVSWGLVIFAQSFAAWFGLVVEYGFSLSATRLIARQREDRRFVARISSGVLGAKIVLSVGVAFASFIALTVIPGFREHPNYLLWAVVQTIAAGFNPLWYFQGMERMRGPAIIDILSRLVCTGVLFFQVSGPADAWKVMFLNAVDESISTTISLIWMYKEVPWVRPRWHETILALRQGWSMFLYRGANSLYTTANAFILGMFVPPNIVGQYGGAEKLAKAANGLLAPVSQAFYPKMSNLMASDRNNGVRTIRLTLLLMVGLGLGLGCGIALTAPFVVPILLGAQYGGAVPVLWVLAILFPFSALANVLGVQWMLPLGLDRAFNTIMVLAGLLNIGLAVVLAPKYAAVGMAAAVVISEVFVAVSMYWVLRSKGLDPIWNTRTMLKS